MMFSEEEVEYLENKPERIREAVLQHIYNTACISNNIEEELSNLLSKSYLKDSKWINEALKTDMLFWYFAYGFSFNEYLCYQFIDKTKEERMEFLSDRESVSFGYDMNDVNDLMVFGDKTNTYNKYRAYFGREAITLAESADFNAYKNFIKIHRRFVKKNVYEACGRGIEFIDLDSDKRSEYDLFEHLISEGKVLLEEVVKQSEKMGIFNGSTVNTIRCITFNSKQGIMIPYCFMKIGRKGALVDNGGQGGILVGIDPVTGMLSTDGVDENGIRYETHPDSKIQFKGYELPEWSNMISMCEKMAQDMPTVRLIGWDTAHTDKGWIVIEGNALTEVIGMQSTWLRGIRSDVNGFYKMIKNT